MSRHTTLFALLAAAVVCLVVVDAARTETPSPELESSFGGRPIIVEKAGVHFGISEHARFETVGDSGFVVLRITPASGTSYDYWQPLSEISNIRVFDSLADGNRPVNRW